MSMGPGTFVRRWEPWLVWLLGAIALAAIPVVQGQSSIIWDAINHHIYLGWTAEHPRFDRDYLAANWQSYQYPYVYWPAYKLALAGFSGVTAGIVLCLLQSLAVPPVWLVARCLCPGERVEDIALRWIAVTLALLGAVTLSLADTTSNDVLAGLPLVWAVAFGMMANEDGAASQRRQLTLVALSGACAGISVAFKLSNGPLALVLPVLWVAFPGPVKAAAFRVAIGGVATVLGLVLAYAPWGWVLWQHFGNPVHPYHFSIEVLLNLLGWQQP